MIPMSAPRGEITLRMIQALEEAGPWTRFLAITQFLLAGMNGIWAIGLLLSRELGLVGLILTGIYAGVSLVYVLWGLSLLRFAGAVKRISGGGREMAVERALGHARDFWQRVGLASLGGLCLMMLAVILGLSLGMGKDVRRGERLREMQQAAPSWWRPSQLPALQDMADACSGEAGQNATFLCIHEGVFDEDGELESGREQTVLRGTVSRFTPRREGWDGTRVKVTDGQETWEVAFVPPAGHPLVPGLYVGAAPEDPDPPGDPELSRIGLLHRRGRACQTTDSRFQVHEIGWDAYGQIRRLTVDFEASCPEGEEDGKTWKTVGRLQLALPENGRG
jgi:hypothetical protein